MTLKDLWMLYEADKRILGFSMHTMKAYFLQPKMLVRELGDLEIEQISLNLLKDYFARVCKVYRYQCLNPGGLIRVEFTATVTISFPADSLNVTILIQVVRGTQITDPIVYSANSSNTLINS